METNNYGRFKNEFIKIEKDFYKVQEVTPDGILKCNILDEKGCVSRHNELKEIDLTKIELRDVMIIGPQPGWLCE